MQQASIRASLIISVYDNIRFLKAVLDSVCQQSCMAFEIIISEDAEHTQVKDFLATYPFLMPWQHLTQPDNGWQKNRALNRAIRAAKSDYLILIDGDCILHPDFVRQHLSHAASNRILAGKRIKLNQRISTDYLSKNGHPLMLHKYILRHFFRLKKEGFRFHEEGLFLPDSGLIGTLLRKRRVRELKGCNMSFPKEAILAINGFDETYQQPAIGEDVDLTWRFRAAGYTLQSVRNAAVQYHLYHKEHWHDQSENKAKMLSNQKANRFFCEMGINQHIAIP